jgi:hypothetical protein
MATEHRGAGRTCRKFVLLFEKKKPCDLITVIQGSPVYI